MWCLKQHRASAVCLGAPALVAGLLLSNGCILWPGSSNVASFAVRPAQMMPEVAGTAECPGSERLHRMSQQDSLLEDDAAESRDNIEDALEWLGACLQHMADLNHHQPMQEEQGIEEFPLYDAVKDKPLHIYKVVINGLQRTKLYLVSRELQQLTDEEHTLDEIKDDLLRCQEALEGLGVFKGVELVLDSGHPAQPDSCTVIVNCVEKSPWTAHAGTFATDTEVTFEGTAGAQNLAGYAEQVELKFEFGSARRSEYALVVRRPRLGGSDVQGEVQVLQQQRSFQEQSSFTEELRGASTTLSTEDGTHALSYELGWRSVFDYTRLASHAVAAQTGHQLKSALRYTYHWDTFDSSLMPSEGWGGRWSTEVAGLGPDARLLRYAKSHLHALWATPLPFLPDGALLLSGTLGAMLPWGPGWDRRPTTISDRFWLGGVGTVRGFRVRGLGPTAARRVDPDEPDVAPKHDALGGDLAASVVAAVRFQLPFQWARQAGVCGHVFGNGGSSVLLTGQRRSLQQGLQQFGSSWRWSVGTGLIWPTNLGTIEINFCHILKKHAHDKAKTGMQFGISPAMY